MYKSTILPRARKKYQLLAPMLNQSESIVDIGCGNGGLSKLLLNQGYKVQGADIIDNSYYDDVQPIIFNGKQLPVENRSFDTALIITVLHHTTYQKELLLEAQRVAKRVIVMEDVYSHEWGKRITHFTDSLVNLEFKGHPHTNRTRKGWMEFFKELNYTVHQSIDTRTLGYFRQVVYDLQAPSAH